MSSYLFYFGGLFKEEPTIHSTMYLKSFCRHSPWKFSFFPPAKQVAFFHWKWKCIDRYEYYDTLLFATSWSIINYTSLCIVIDVIFANQRNKFSQTFCWAAFNYSFSRVSQWATHSGPGNNVAACTFTMWVDLWQEVWSQPSPEWIGISRTGKEPVRIHHCTSRCYSELEQKVICP